jgi:hypothetical protein
VGENYRNSNDTGGFALCQGGELRKMMLISEERPRRTQKGKWKKEKGGANHLFPFPFFLPNAKAFCPPQGR